MIETKETATMRSEYKTYNVHATFKYPAWDEKNGFDLEIRARSKAEANQKARRQMEMGGHCDRQSPMSFKATEMEGGE
jgi:hypothetical protein